MKEKDMCYFTVHAEVQPLYQSAILEFGNKVC